MGVNLPDLASERVIPSEARSLGLGPQKPNLALGVEGAPLRS
jgi:hypothetical protein